jgi:Ca-activated chloride channel family protein
MRRLSPFEWGMFAVAAIAAVAIYAAIDVALAGRTMLTIEGVGDRPIDLLAPEWLKLVAVTPFFFVVRHFSLTDLALTQQLLQAGLRSLVIVAAALALARPSWTTKESKVATVVLVDVSDSVSDAQLEAAKKYLAELDAAGGEDTWMSVVTFAEKPQVAKRDGGR